MWIQPASILSLVFVGFNSGAGIHLGKDLILSVAHVVGGRILKKPKVIIAGQTLIATVVKENPFEQRDLALLEIAEEQLPVRLRLRRIPCVRLNPGRQGSGQPICARTSTVTSCRQGARLGADRSLE